MTTLCKAEGKRQGRRRKRQAAQTAKSPTARPGWMLV